MKNLLLTLFLLFFSISCNPKKDLSQSSKHEPSTIVELTPIVVEHKVTDEEKCLYKIEDIEDIEDEKESSVFIDLKKHYYNAKGHPVFLIKEPDYYFSDDRVIISHRDRFNRANAWKFLISDTNRKFYKYNKNIGYNTFLREGYLYHPNPTTSKALSELVTIDMLVGESIFYIHRGSLKMKVEKKGGRYWYADGPYKGRTATIQFMDRILLSGNYEDEPLHLDFAPIKDDLGFDTITPTLVSSSFVVADINYGELKSQALLKRNGASVDLICETTDTSEVRDKRSYRGNGIRLMKKAMMEQVQEKIPFDEPKYEVGQEDGKLRDAWLNYFYRGSLKYQYTNQRMTEENYIYGHLGKPLPPQVCVDFLVDTIDRTAGSWYTDVGDRRKPQKTEGTFNSTHLRYKDEDGKDKHYAIRNVRGFTHFASDHPEWFEIINVDDKVKIGSDDFFTYLKTLKLQEGDMVFIRGEVPWDENKEHFHSFIIYQNDPVSGMPVLLAMNAGHAALRPWKIETNRTPKRHIFRVIRMTDRFVGILSEDKE